MADRAPDIGKMSTLVQIEDAVTCLPPHEQRTLLKWLEDRLKDEGATASADGQGLLETFRSLQKEVGLTAEEAMRWKAETIAARR